MKVKENQMEETEKSNIELEKEYNPLNEKQKIAYEEAISIDNDIVFITGSPGTGKSFTAKYIIDYFSEITDNSSIVALAPSHQSKVVLRDMIYNDSIDVKTTQSYCNMVPDFYSEKDFKWTGKYPEEKQVILIDEISMVSQQQFDLIRESSSKIICLGDKNQLLSVGENNADMTHIKTIELTEQMRQEKTNTSLYMAIQRYKEAIQSNSKVDLSGVPEDDTLSLVRERKVLFSKFVKSEIHSKVIVAAKNDMVNTYNLQVKNVVGESMYEKDDILITQSPVWEVYKQDKKADFNNGDILKVHSVKFVNNEIMPYNEVSVSYTTIDRPTNKICIPSNNELYEERLQALRADAKANPKLWKLFYKFKNQFAEVKHAYSMTSWKTQGSTFDQVYIDHQDIGSIQHWADMDTYNRAMYISLSRAKKHATILL